MNTGTLQQTLSILVHTELEYETNFLKQHTHLTTSSIKANLSYTNLPDCSNLGVDDRIDLSVQQ